METLVKAIMEEELNEEVQRIGEIKGLGTVNTIFEIKGKKGDYILRLNKDDKRIEYSKEKWCMDKIAEIGIPTATVLSIGRKSGFCFMLQIKITGINGSQCNADEKSRIWFELGRYAAKFQKIKRIEDQEFEKTAFHKDWKARLKYNIAELNKADSLIKEGVLNEAEQNKAKEILRTLETKEFETGLVHGDLCPRNVIVNQESIHLLDWGTAGTNVVPHTEIGILLLSNEASKTDFETFLNGMGITAQDYKAIEEEVNILNFLHQLDIYRWAEAQGIPSLNDYPLKVRNTFNAIK